MSISHKMTEQQYNALPGIRSSHLKIMASRSPRHYRHAVDSYGITPPSPAMQLGTAVHCAILEPDVFATKYVVYPGKIRRGAQWEEFQRLHEDHSIITASERETARTIADAVMDHQTARDLLKRGSPEVPLFWNDPHTGLVCKARADWLCVEDRVMVGIKTTREIGDQFINQSARLMYHLSWAYYADGYHANFGHDPSMYEISVETTAPYDVVVYRIGDDVLVPGRAEYQRALGMIQECTASGVWPGYASEVVDMSIPAWATKRIFGDDDWGVE